MTTDQAIRDAKNRWARRRRRAIAYGQWEPFTDAEPARRHVLAIQATGMGLARIAAHTGVNRGSLDHLLYGSTPHPPAVHIRAENAEALLAFWPSLDDYEDHNVIDATGTRRRSQALAAAGWNAKAMYSRMGVASPRTIERLRNRDKVTARLARAIRDFYSEVSAKTAEDYGVEPWIADRTRAYAIKRRWADAAGWDDDTIDDPNAHPEWTGHCGTDRGWWKHNVDAIPTCPRCEAAHAAWLAERRDLPAAERFRQLASAKAAASQRGANLAHDARELMRVSGLTREQAAARLGVHKTYVDQAMKAHPQTELAA